MTNKKFLAKDTSIRWFGHWEPANHGESTRVPIPVGMPCVLCKRPFTVEDVGYTIPHMNDQATVLAAPKKAQEWFKPRPYHQDCLLEWLGLPEPDGGVLG